jgi:hypothetical protein
MQRIYHPWYEWECFKAGFYSSETVEHGKEKYAEFLSDLRRFEVGINHVFTSWRKSCEQFVTNENINRIAWIGQSSMCIMHQVPSRYRGGFYLLSDIQQRKANGLAHKYLLKWIGKHEANRSIHRTVETDGLFG